MTNEDAIKELRMCELYSSGSLLNALEYAINVLEQLPNHVYSDTDSIKTVDTNNEWSKLPTLLRDIPWEQLRDILDDAITNGFEVKIVDSTIYYRETTDVHN